MNERIKELAEQAGWIDDKQFASWDKVYQWQNFDKEKFALLIVQECAELSTKEYNNYSPIHGNDLLEHFGVKE
jgi:superfamily II DNA or RNA helicase